MSPATPRRESLAHRIGVAVASVLVATYLTASTAAHWSETQRLASIEAMLKARADTVDRLLALHHERIGDLERAARK